EYDGGDRLFVPVHRLSLVSRYVGAEGVPPRLDKLGGVTGEKAKARVKHALRDMARGRLSVHAARDAAQGLRFCGRDPRPRGVGGGGWGGGGRAWAGGGRRIGSGRSRGWGRT